MTSRHGTSFPLGATVVPGGVNFSVFSKHGSPDVFGHEGREVEQSINFVTCHDGSAPAATCQSSGWA
jgi:pullulanase/glycogen debranching enzyme